MPKELRGQLAGIRLKKAMVGAGIVQDLADSLLALNDIRGALSYVPHCQLSWLRHVKGVSAMQTHPCEVLDDCVTVHAIQDI